MLTLRDHQSRELFDPWEHLGVKRRRLLEVSWAGVFREYLLEHLPVKELSAGSVMAMDDRAKIFQLHWGR